MARARPDPPNVSFDELLRGDGLAARVAQCSRDPSLRRGGRAVRAAIRRAQTPDERWEPRALLSEPLLSAAEAGALLGIPRSSVYDYAKRGELPHVRVGKHVKFIRQDLERALAERRVGI